MTVRATWHEAVLAESDDTVVVEGNHYFPPEAVKPEHLVESSNQTFCPWKGTASYYDVRVGDETNTDAAWYYPRPFPAARQIADRVAFWHGVEVTGDGGTDVP